MLIYGVINSPAFTSSDERLLRQEKAHHKTAFYST